MRRSRSKLSATIVVVGWLLFVSSFALPAADGLNGWQAMTTAFLLVLLRPEIIVLAPLRDAGRLLLAKQEDGSSIDLLELPKELARLHPNHAYIDSRGSLKLEFGGGFYHYGLYVVPEDTEGITLDIDPPLKFTPLATGIWFYEET